MTTLRNLTDKNDKSGEVKSCEFRAKFFFFFEEGNLDIYNNNIGIARQYVRIVIAIILDRRNTPKKKVDPVTQILAPLYLFKNRSQ